MWLMTQQLMTETEKVGRQWVKGSVVRVTW